MTLIHIENSYKTWLPCQMKPLIQIYCFQKYNTDQANKILKRSYLSMYIEWWAHNVGYYVSKPFPKYQRFNLRCKDVDLEEWL